MFCTQCGSEVKQGSSFCSNCGKRMVFAPAKEKITFCTQCGSEVKPGSGFCTKCGKAMALAPTAEQRPAQAPVPPAAPKAPAPPAAEEAVWVFTAQRKYSMLKMVACYVVFMKDRAVLAHLTPALQKAESAKVSQDVKEQGMGFFKGSAAMMGYWANYYKKYYGMTSAAILAEDPSNMVLEYKNISQVLFKGFSDNTNFDDGTSNVTQGKLHFTLTNGETIKFMHSQWADKSVREILEGLFGAKLKYRK